MQNVNIHVLEGSGRLKDYKQEIESSIEEALGAVDKELELKDVDFVVVDSPSQVIPETGEGGYCPGPHVVYISLDPDYEDFESKVIPSYIKGTVAHEAHHAMRSRAVGYGKTLFESVVTEGLADNFEVQVYEDSCQPWVSALSGSEIHDLVERFEQEKNKKDYDHAEWFFGEGDLPRWAGYTLGFRAVGDYLQETGQTAAELVDEPAKAFEESVNKVLGIEEAQNG